MNRQDAAFDGAQALTEGAKRVSWLILQEKAGIKFLAKFYETLLACLTACGIFERQASPLKNIRKQCEEACGELIMSYAILLGGLGVLSE